MSTVPAVRVVKPEFRNLTHTVAQPGYVEAYEQTSLYSKVSGFIKSFSVDIGQQVKKGDVLAEIFVPELEEELQRKHAQVQLDKQSIEHAHTLVQVAESDVQTAIARLHEAKANVGKFQAEVVRWESELKRLTQMVQERVVDRQVLDESLKQRDSAKSARDAAEAGVAAREAERVSAEADVAKAKIDVEVARSKVLVSEADARQTAAMQSYTKVTAPYDAVVTVRNANTGDFVQAASGDKSAAKGAPIFVVARTDLFRLFVEVPEAFARYVQVGTKAMVRAEALNGLEIPATVTRTSWSLEVKSRTLRTEIDLPAKDCDGLRPGMYVYGKVVIEQPQVRVLPQETLIVLGNQTYCYLLEEGKAVKTSVQRGISEGAWAQVLKKKVGDSWTDFTGDEAVIAGDLSELADGEAVAVAPAESPGTGAAITTAETPQGGALTAAGGER
jgi:HlyD family secretion protein